MPKRLSSRLGDLMSRARVLRAAIRILAWDPPEGVHVEAAIRRCSCGDCGGWAVNAEVYAGGEFALIQVGGKAPRAAVHGVLRDVARELQARPAVSRAIRANGYG